MWKEFCCQEVQQSATKPAVSKKRIEVSATETEQVRYNTILLICSDLFFFMQVGSLSTDTIYRNNVKRFHTCYPLSNGIAYAIADCNTSGQLTRGYCLVQRVTFQSMHSPEAKGNVFLCSCDSALPQRERLLATDKDITEPLDNFLQRERSVCLQLRVRG